MRATLNEIIHTKVLTIMPGTQMLAIIFINTTKNNENSEVTQ